MGVPKLQGSAAVKCVAALNDGLCPPVLQQTPAAQFLLSSCLMNSKYKVLKDQDVWKPGREFLRVQETEFQQREKGSDPVAVSVRLSRGLYSTWVNAIDQNLR